MNFQDELRAIHPKNPHEEYIQNALQYAKSDYRYNIKESIITAVKNNDFQQLGEEKEVIAFAEINTFRHNFALKSQNAIKYYFTCTDNELVTRYMQELIKYADNDDIQIKIAFQFRRNGGGVTYLYPNSVIDDFSINTTNWKAGVLCKTTF